MKQILFCVLITAGCPAIADPANVRSTNATQSGGTWRFDVTVSHPDTGWEHYVDGWRVLAMDGTELGMRVLHHPHVDEQPFTRSLSGVVVPEGADKVQIQTRCVVDGWSDKKTTVKLR